MHTIISYMVIRTIKNCQSHQFFAKRLMKNFLRERRQISSNLGRLLPVWFIRKRSRVTFRNCQKLIFSMISEQSAFLSSERNNIILKTGSVRHQVQGRRYRFIEQAVNVRFILFLLSNIGLEKFSAPNLIPII